MNIDLNLNLLIPIGVFIILIGVYFLLKKRFESKTLQSRLTSVKGQQEQPIFEQAPSVQSNLPSIIRIPLEALIDVNKSAVLRFKLEFEQCGWNAQAAPFLVPAIKVVGILIFIGCFLMINATIPQFRELP